MYNTSEGISPVLQSGAETDSVETAGLWFGENTFSRSRVVKFFSIKTEDEANNFPCNTVRGPRVGQRCSFPFRYPDCSLEKRLRACDDDPDSVPVEYNSCTEVDSEGLWCYTQTYPNRSHIIGEWGYCDKRCNLETAR